MSLAHLYPDFSVARTGQGQTGEAVGLEAMEDQKLDAFEKGYQAGWDDSVKAQEADKTRITSDFAQNLQDMSFSYHEAIAKLTVAMKPLFELMVTKVLPTSAQASIGAKIQEQLLEMSKNRMETAVEIAVSPENAIALEDMIAASEVTCPFEIISEPSLGAGQIYLRSATGEREIDLDAVTDGIAEAVTAFFQQFQKEQADV